MQRKQNQEKQQSTEAAAPLTVVVFDRLFVVDTPGRESATSAEKLFFRFVPKSIIYREEKAHAGVAVCLLLSACSTHGRHQEYEAQKNNL